MSTGSSAQGADHERIRRDKLVIVVAAFWLTILGGLVLAVDMVVGLPIALGVIGALAFLGGLVAVFILSLAHARRMGGTVTASLWKGFRDALRWAGAFMP